jgi:hypothetical protein
MQSVFKFPLAMLVLDQVGKEYAKEPYTLFV